MVSAVNQAHDCCCTVAGASGYKERIPCLGGASATESGTAGVAGRDWGALGAVTSCWGEFCQMQPTCVHCCSLARAAQPLAGTHGPTGPFQLHTAVQCETPQCRTACHHARACQAATSGRYISVQQHKGSNPAIQVT